MLHPSNWRLYKSCYMLTTSQPSSLFQMSSLALSSVARTDQHCDYGTCSACLWGTWVACHWQCPAARLSWAAFWGLSFFWSRRYVSSSWSHTSSGILLRSMLRVTEAVRAVYDDSGPRHWSSWLQLGIPTRSRARDSVHRTRMSVPQPDARALAAARWEWHHRRPRWHTHVTAARWPCHHGPRWLAVRLTASELK